MFVVVEGGAGPKLDWKSLRQQVVAAGGYVSLALVDGSRSNWIVRPVPTTAQIPAQVSTAGSAAAQPGIAASVIDQVLEAQALVPVIQSTEVRLYGGALVETELNDALKGEKSIQLRVFDKAGFRAGQSTHKPPAAAKSAGMPVKGSAASTKPSSSAPASSPGGQGSSAQSNLGGLRKGQGSAPAAGGLKYGPMNPNSAAGRMAASAQRAPVRGTVPSQSATATSSTSAATARRPQESFNKRFQPARRFFAAVLSAAVVGIGVFPGYVWTHIWGYSYPGDAPIIADTVSYAQSRAFGISLLFGALIAFIGTRVRWLTLLGFAYGIVVGVIPAAIPEFLAWPAPPPLATILSNVAGFWGMWTAWAPVLYIGAGIALSVAVVNTLPETPKEVVAARARNRAQTKNFLGQRSPVDRWAITLLAWLGLTGLVPWLLGRFVLQGTLFKPGPGVFDIGARDFWPYVPPLYLGGLATLLLLAGLAMVFQPWPGRNGLGITGVVLLVAGIAAGSFGTSLWSSAEGATAERLTSTAFPFGDQFLTCGHANATLTDASGKASLWQVWTARIQNSNVGSGECNRIEVYKGWQLVNKYDLPTGVTITAGPDFVSGSTTTDAVFRYVKSDGQTIQMRLNGG